MGGKLEINIEEFRNEFTDEGYLVEYRLIDNNNDFNFNSIKVNGLDLHEYWRSLDTILQFIIDKYLNRVNKFILTIDWGEAFASMEHRVIFDNDVNKYIINFFKDNGILDRLYWRSNGLNPQFKSDVKFEPISFWLGKNIEYLSEITPRKFDYNFLSLYRGYKNYREEFHNFLQDNDILKNTLYSYNSEFEDAPYWTNDYKISLDGDSVTAEMLVQPGNYYFNTFCSIVYEALWDLKVVFPTEKLNKCLLTGHPFIIVSTPRYLANIKKIGFKTFDKWWDESYDDEINNYSRFNKLKEVVLDINQWSLEKCESVYEEMIPTLIHNQTILKNLSNFNTSNTYNILDIEIDDVSQNKDII